MFLKLCVTLLVAWAGARVALRLKVPAGAVIGSLLFVGAFSVLSNFAYFPAGMRAVTQAVAGAFIGMSVRRKDIEELRLIIVPSLAFFLGVCVIGLSMGYLTFLTTNMDAPTSFLACVPAGITDMSLMSHDLGADGAQVAVLQLVRLLIAIGVTPVISKNIIAHFGQGRDSQSKSPQPQPEETSAPAQANHFSKRQKILRTLLATAAGGAAGYFSGIPAGAMTFAMIAVAFLSVRFEGAYLHPKVRTVAQIFAGTLIGTAVTMETVLKMRELLLPALIVASGCFVINYGLGLLIAWLGKIDLATMLFASTPAGLSDVALIAIDVGGDAPKVIVFQLVRFIGIITVMPSIIKFVCSFLVQPT